jgi:hypothetical protein
MEITSKLQITRATHRPAQQFGAIERVFAHTDRPVGSTQTECQRSPSRLRSVKYDTTPASSPDSVTVTSHGFCGFASRTYYALENVKIGGFADRSPAAAYLACRSYRSDNPTR